MDWEIAGKKLEGIQFLAASHGIVAGNHRWIWEFRWLSKIKFFLLINLTLFLTAGASSDIVQVSSKTCSRASYFCSCLSCYGSILRGGHFHLSSILISLVISKITSGIKPNNLNVLLFIIEDLR